MNRKHGLLLFLCACIPGCGQMYQGYMRRGVSLLGLGCGAVFLLALGPDNFLLPALCTTVAVLLLARPVLNREKEAA